MMQYLHRLKGKKGFTMVELFVVIAIIAVLSTIIVANMVGGNDKQLSANASAKSFFTATQLAVTRAQLTERELVNYGADDIAYIAYYNGANHVNNKKMSAIKALLKTNPAQAASDNCLFIEAKFSQNGIAGLHIKDTLTDLMKQPDPVSTTTALEAYIAQNIDEYMSENYEGYFYALVDNNFKVLYTHFCEKRLPQYTDGNDKEEYRKQISINSVGRLVGNDCILGCCFDPAPGSKDSLLPVNTQTAFSTPTKTDNETVFKRYMGD